MKVLPHALPALSALGLVPLVPWLLGSWPAPAGDALQQGGTREPVRSEAAYTAHEWGTFTTVIGASGQALTWNPFGLTSPLPEFVYRAERWKPNYFGNVRMETPVVYFYADNALELDARVEFPNGVLTEWYPAADKGEHDLVWRNVRLSPEAPGALATTLSGAHYFAARGVAATPLRASNGEEEKFLFYRGVGTFEQPLGIAWSADGSGALELSNRGEEDVASVLLFENREGHVALTELGALAAGSTLSIPIAIRALDFDASLAPLERVLREAGLYADEARAMIATWRGDWFEPGLRVFYVVPRATTDRLLPLHLAPAPEKLERVLVGRLELLEAEFEAEVHAAARAVAETGASAEQAFGALARGRERFALAYLQSLGEREPELATAQWLFQQWSATLPGAR